MLASSLPSASPRPTSDSIEKRALNSLGDLVVGIHSRSESNLVELVVVGPIVNGSSCWDILGVDLLKGVVVESDVGGDDVRVEAVDIIGGNDE